MRWETFQRPRRGKRSELAATVSPNGNVIALSAAARAALGNPARVVLLYDAAERLLAVRAAGPDEVAAYRVSPASGGVSIRGLLNAYATHATPGRRAAELLDHPDHGRLVTVPL